MSIKTTKGIFVRMTKKEFKAYLKDHPNASHVELSVSVKRFCDICGKRINENKYWSSGHVQFTDYHYSEFHDLCSTECEKEFMRRALERFENQPSDATNKISGITINRLDKYAKEEVKDK